MRIIADFLFLILFGALLLAWFLAWALMHVASGGIHILLGLAVVCLVLQVFRSRSAA